MIILYRIGYTSLKIERFEVSFANFITEVSNVKYAVLNIGPV